MHDVLDIIRNVQTLYAVGPTLGILKDFERVVDELDLNIRYYIEGNIKTTEIFDGRPFELIVVNSADSINISLSRQEPIFIKIISLDEFYFFEGENGQERKGNFDQVLKLKEISVVLVPNLNKFFSKGKISENTIRIDFSSPVTAVSYYRSAISVGQVNKSSSVIEIGLVSPLKDKAQAVLNELIKQYNIDAVEDRNMISQNTANFIENRLAIITGELDTVESGKVEFKQENRVTDIAAEGQIFLENASDFKNRQLEVETQLSLVNTMITNLQGSSATDLLPANIGIENNGVPQLIENYNRIVLERNRLLRSATESNPLVISITSQLLGLKSNILQSMQNARTALRISRNDLRNQDAQIGSKISSIPSKEKQIRSITRQQEIKEELYLYLLKKREETSISLAVTTPKAKVVDYAYSSNAPISPKKQIIMLTALIIGLLIPFLFIYARNLLDNKIRNRNFVERKSKDVPVIGEIPLLDNTEDELVQSNDRSVLAESFRILRTNLQYLFVSSSPQNDNAKCIFITSTVKGEGKTFVSVNLALTLANSGNKVLIIGADLRNPQLQRYMTDVQRTKRGVTEYLINNGVPSNDFIFQSELNANMSIMISGAIPPNPAELWLQPRATELFEEVRQAYDYVIVDTAPSMLVTDTFLINKHADIMLYVIRAGFTEKRLLDFPLDNIKNGKLKNVSFVLNSVSLANFGYGNKYGYSYGDTEQTFWEKVKKSFKR